MRLLPRSLLWRTFLLLALLMLLAVAAWLALFRAAELEPRARQLAQMITSVTNLTRAALLAARPEHRHDLLAELSDREGVHIYPADADDAVVPPPSLPLTERLEELLTERLGPETRLAFVLNGESGLFVRFRIFEGEEGDFWLALPRERLDRHFPLYWLGWGMAVFLLALAGAWLIVFRIVRPLRALEAAARKIGAGETPPALPESGPTEIAAVTAAFNRMSASLAQLEKDRALLLAGVSHDLRTPLTRLRMEAELSVPEAATRNAMEADIVEMDRIIGQFLDFARPNDQHMAENIDPALLIEDVARRYDERVKTLLCAGPGGSVRAQPSALRRAIVNLVENALRHGSAETPVELTLKREGKEIIIAVLDRGPGIPAEQIEHLIQPFTRGEEARTGAQGAGLGLAIVERIARSHGGRLVLQPRSGGGLAAEIRLPTTGN